MGVLPCHSPSSLTGSGVEGGWGYSHATHPPPSQGVGWRVGGGTPMPLTLLPHRHGVEGGWGYSHATHPPPSQGVGWRVGGGTPMPLTLLPHREWGGGWVGVLPCHSPSSLTGMGWRVGGGTPMPLTLLPHREWGGGWVGVLPCHSPSSLTGSGVEGGWGYSHATHPPPSQGVGWRVGGGTPMPLTLLPHRRGVEISGDTPTHPLSIFLIFNF